NPNDASDGKQKTLDTEKEWYTNLEVYANSLVEDIMKAGMADGESNYTEYFPAYQTTAISAVRTSAITATEYYDLNGRRLAEPQRGVNIRVERMANGQAVTTKVIK
ncbi:MAG: pectate lyase, partial [Prevotella sp.]|nr:pectate lyase [Prevotella sp.]